MRNITLLASLAFCLGLHAQEDITPFYMTNAGFDEKFNYDASRTTNVAGDIINNVYGWTNTSTTTYTVAGTFEWNGKAKFNSGSAIPAAGHDGATGGGLALSTGWAQTLSYEQSLTLSKGTYKIATAAYNTGSYKNGSLKVKWTPASGTGAEIEITNIASKAWTTGEAEFNLTATKKGTITVSFTADNVGSANNAKPIVDYVKILAVDMDLTTPLNSLKSAISSATTQYGDGTGVNAEVLKEVIDRAQGIYDDEAHTAIQILSVTAELKQATVDNKLDNASPEKPYNVTSTYLVNPSFENGLTGWTSVGMNTQSNSYFTKKSGSNYAEIWVGAGNQLGSFSLSQTLSNIPAGRYRLTAATLHIQQSGSNSTVNKGEAQTGACLFADKYSTAIDTLKDRSVEFVVLGDEATIGVRAENATGNWACVDNFRLYYLGRVSAADQVEAIQAQMDYIESSILSCHMQDKAREAMAEAMDYAKGVIGSPTAEGVERAIFLLDSCTTVCQASTALYDALKARIDYATQVLEWVKDNESKVATLQNAIASAESKWNDFTLANSQLKSAVNALNNAIKSVDKAIYTAEWSMGNVSDPNNKWYTGRTVESKDWVLFWEKGYGDNVPVNFRCGSHNVNAYETLEHAQTAFDFYADSLKYINRSKSKTNQYKMVIRLRYEESEWEATGSGVDDKIGLLTLTPWAQTSRNWQTVYHEVGHCFQYQTHCDNGDWNGWMYTVGPKGTAFWEQCAQWQAYKIMPYDQFTNEWYGGYLANVHKHILHEGPRYNNYFVMDYWCMKHGMDFMGKMWNQCKNPEDACETYQRITNITNEEFNDEMWDCAARFATWDIPHLAPYHKDTWNQRPQPGMSLDKDKYWVINPDMAPENTGHNIIQLNAPTKACIVSAVFEGLAGDSRYRQNYLKEAGWRYGFVALLKDGTRVYGEPGKKASYTEPKDTVTFECPAGCQKLWFVVSGASTTYHMHGWDDDDSNDEQYGYRVMFDNTNRSGSTNNHITGVDDVLADAPANEGVYTITGVKLRETNSIQGLPAGIYVVGGKKVSIK